MKVNCCNRVILNLEESNAVQRPVKHFNDLAGRRLKTTPEKFENGKNIFHPIHSTTPGKYHQWWKRLFASFSVRLMRVYI